MTIPVINHQEIPEIEMRAGIRGRFLASTEHEARGVCLLINTAVPGAAAPLHKHTVEETMLVLDGTVWVQIGDERYTVRPQHTVIIPAETPHAWGNAGPNVAKLLWAFGGPTPSRIRHTLRPCHQPLHLSKLASGKVLCIYAAGMNVRREAAASTFESLCRLSAVFLHPGSMLRHRPVTREPKTFGIHRVLKRSQRRTCQP